MNNKTTLVLALTLVATACGDSVPPAAPGTCTYFRCNDDGYGGAGGSGGYGGAGGSGGYAGAGGSGGQGGAGGEPGGCLDDAECELGEVCISSAFNGVGIPDEVVDVPGVCFIRPPVQELRVITFTPMFFEDEEVGVRDPATDAFVPEMGVFDVTNAIKTFRFAPEPVPWGQFALPYRSPPLVVPFTWEVEFYLRVDSIECTLVFGPEGLVSGGVLRETGELLCSTYNWLPPQSPDARGLVVEYEVRPAP